MVKPSLFAAALCVGALAFTAPAVSNKYCLPLASLNLSLKDIEECGKKLADGVIVSGALVVGPMANAVETPRFHIFVTEEIITIVVGQLFCQSSSTPNLT